MTKTFRAIAIIVAIILLGVSTYGGVLATSTLNNLSLGSTSSNVTLDDVDGNVGMVNVLLIGVDEDGYRSDTIMLVSLDSYSDRVSILSIPRDTMVTINGSIQKINASMAFSTGATATPTPEDAEDTGEKSGLAATTGNEQTLINKIKEITGLPIHYYITVDFNGFIDLIDAVDGIDFDVPYDMDYDDPAQDLHIHLTAGEQHLDGKGAHDFVRFRHNNDGSAPGEYVMGDEGRVYWQQQFIKELFRQKMTPYYLSKIDDVYEVFCNNVRTNLTFTEILRNLNALSSISVDDVTAYELPGEAAYMYDLWYYIYDPEETDELIEDVFYPQSREQWEEYLASQEAGA